ncbi:hypothetical protein Dimus_020262 [Dionaea muscipula]
MDLTYMDYLLTKKKVNLPRVTIRHMAYVINVANHELPYGELLTRIFEAFNVPLNYKKGEDPKSGLKRRRDDEEVNDEAENAANIEEEHIERQADKDEDLGCGEKFYDAVADERPVDEDISAPTVEVPAPVVPDVAIDKQQEKAKSSGVDPSSSLTDYDLLHLQAEFARALQRKTRFQELF